MIPLSSFMTSTELLIRWVGGCLMRGRHPYPGKRGGTYVTCQERRKIVGSECKLGSKVGVKGSFTGLGSDNELRRLLTKPAVNLPYEAPDTVH